MAQPGDPARVSARRRLLVTATIGALLLVLGAASSTFAASSPKYLVCHASGSGTYVAIHVPFTATGPNGHNSHSDDIWPEGTYVTKDGATVHLAGRNWPIHSDIWTRGCPGTGNNGKNDHMPKPTHHDEDAYRTICHAVGVNLYTRLTVRVDEHGLAGHANDPWDIWPGGTFTFDDDHKVVIADRNWTALGQATYANHCVVPAGNISGPTMPPTTVVEASAPLPTTDPTPILAALFAVILLAGLAVPSRLRRASDD